jgi:hypothetical protein
MHVSLSKYEGMKVGAALSHLSQLSESVDKRVDLEDAGIRLIDLEEHPFD